MVIRLYPKFSRFALGLAATLILLATLNGCTEPLDACYTPSTQLTDVNAPVSFENCTEPVAQSYLWTFGDGTTSTEVNPTHTFTTEGQFIVGLTAKAKSSVNDDITETLVVGAQRLFASGQILNLPATNPIGGGAWDAGDNPDIAVRFTKGSTQIYQSATQANATMTFPMAIPTPPTTLVLAPTAWTISVLDIDGGSEEVMATFTIDLGPYIPNANRKIDLAAGGVSRMEITYTLR